MAIQTKGRAEALDTVSVVENTNKLWKVAGACQRNSPYLIDLPQFGCWLSTGLADVPRDLLRWKTCTLSWRPINSATEGLGRKLARFFNQIVPRGTKLLQNANRF
jgi:hypothetical protein